MLFAHIILSAIVELQTDLETSLLVRAFPFTLMLDTVGHRGLQCLLKMITPLKSTRTHGLVRRPQTSPEASSIYFFPSDLMSLI